MATETLLELYDALREDRQRQEARPFSQDILEANRLLHHPFALDHEVAEALNEWCRKRQPCQFGRVAASRGHLHFCVLRERDLAGGDQGVASKIAGERMLWKRRAILDRKAPPHAFLLVFASPRVALAAPDVNLQRFAERLLALSGWGPERRRSRSGNSVSSDFLYLRSPKSRDDMFYGFQFNLDFFAAAGDGRWWHDHRLPGGIGFTANSTGHMRAFKEWYAEPGADFGEWALKQAMITVANAHAMKKNTSEKTDVDTPGARSPEAEGRVTWLRDLDEAGRPLVASVASPLTVTPPNLKGKDWTRYEGLLHTDHAVRAEFFLDRETPPTAESPYLMDFTYLYDRSQADFMKFSAGVRTSDEEVYHEIGKPETWTTRAGEFAGDRRSAAQAREVQEHLAVIRRWALHEAYAESE